MNTGAAHAGTADAAAARLCGGQVQKLQRLETPKRIVVGVEL